MPASTNKLVASIKKHLVPAAVASTIALGAVFAINRTNVHAAMNTTSPLDDHSVAALTALDGAMESVAAKVTPSVVNIAVTSKGDAEDDNSGDNGNSSAPMPQGQQGQQLPPGLQQFFGQIPGFGGFGGGNGRMQQPQQQQLQHGIGSGVIISPDGYIVTNGHVVNGATDVKVTLHDRRILNAKVIGVDKLTDIAVVKVNATDLPAIAWGDSGRLEPGQTVLAFGSPFGYFQFSVTRGIVSAVDRQNPYSTDARKPGGYIQTDAAINPGNSGGPLVNAHGELVGINTFIISDSGSFAGAGFAIPSQMVRSISQQLMTNGKVEHGYLGISMNDVTPDNAKFFQLHDAAGAIVAQVTPGSPAANAGIKQGDVIRSLNGNAVLNGSALQVLVSEDRPGTKIELGILRNGQPVNLNLTVGQYHAPGDVQSADNSGDGQDGNHTGKLGLAVATLNGDTRQQLNIPQSVNGAVVENVRPGSAADDAGLQPGDVILEVNRHSTTSADQFVSAVHASPSDHDLLLLVWSKGNASYRTLRPDSSQNG
jgi:serine protease Do